MKRLMLMAMGLASLAAGAQMWEPEVNVKTEARVDYQYGWVDGKTLNDQCGFKGQYINLKVDGQFNKHLKYAWRQRFIKNVSRNLLDATDWIYLTYSPNDDWDFTAGKVPVNIGGFEYDRAPIDIYGYSEYCNQIPCYELGVNIARNFGSNDQLIFQVTRNPFYRGNALLGFPENNNTYAYNLMWSGKHGIYSTLWSVNMVEYAKGRYINYIALGNRFDIDRWSLELDFMNRAMAHQTFFFKDFSMMAELRYSFPKVDVFAKTTYDVNKSGRNGDLCVWNGTEIWQHALGAEYFPFTSTRHDIRVHAYVSYAHGTNGNPDPDPDVDFWAINKNLRVNVGLTWRFNIWSYKQNALR